MKLNLGCGRYPLDGFENLNEAEYAWAAGATPWRAQDGLPHGDGTVDAITVSHLLMYLPLADWALLFAEAFRVLQPGGVIRITEDDTAHPASSRQGVQPGACTATSLAVVEAHLAAAGFETMPCGPGGTWYRDRSLLQRWHGEPPDVFFVEGTKP